MEWPTLTFCWDRYPSAPDVEKMAQTNSTTNALAYRLCMLHKAIGVRTTVSNENERNVQWNGQKTNYRDTVIGNESKAINQQCMINTSNHILIMKMLSVILCQQHVLCNRFGRRAIQLRSCDFICVSWTKATINGANCIKYGMYRRQSGSFSTAPVDNMLTHTSW